MKKSFIFILIILTVLLFNCKSSDKEVKSDQIKMMEKKFSTDYEKSFNLWKSKNIQNYSLVIEFSAFSPMAGKWAITVNANEIVNWSFEDIQNDKKYLDFAKGLTIDNLFKNSKDSDDKMFIKKSFYHMELGYPVYIQLSANPDIKDVPTDKTYKYEVIEFNLL